jgi:predicted anti-sigma-YlaC factor YlaD
MDRPSTACERARLWASLAVDSEASELERVSLRAHVEACPDCAAYASEITALARALQEAHLEQPSETWRAEHRSRDERPSGARSRRLLLAAAAVAASLVVGGSIGRLTSPAQQPARSDVGGGSSWMFYTAYQSVPQTNLKARQGRTIPS